MDEDLEVGKRHTCVARRGTATHTCNINQAKQALDCKPDMAAYVHGKPSAVRFNQSSFLFLVCNDFSSSIKDGRFNHWKKTRGNKKVMAIRCSGKVVPTFFAQNLRVLSDLQHVSNHCFGATTSTRTARPLSGPARLINLKGFQVSKDASNNSKGFSLSQQFIISPLPHQETPLGCTHLHDIFV